ncbi:MAG: M23 family metallopeptidase [Bacteroidia bacterium]|nr:M23 family metallopeptidase [Bacteroidia bacterium]
MNYRYFRIPVIIIGTYVLSVVVDSFWNTSHLVASSNRIKYEEQLRIPTFKPVPEEAHVSSAFGMRVHPIIKKWRMHTGIDFPVPIGTPVRAAASGVVTKIVDHAGISSYGKHLIVAHDPIHSTMYAHLSKILVEPGQSVQQGETIALSGNTGLSTSPHLHFEIFKEGKRVDPEAYLMVND